MVNFAPVLCYWGLGIPSDPEPGHSHSVSSLAQGCVYPSAAWAVESDHLQALQEGSWAV